LPALGALARTLPAGEAMELEGSQIAAAVRSTGRRVRVDDFGEGGGPIQAAVRELGHAV
jgi:hypothetical protein